MTGTTSLTSSRCNSPLDDEYVMVENELNSTQTNAGPTSPKQINIVIKDSLQPEVRIEDVKWGFELAKKIAAHNLSALPHPKKSEFVIGDSLPKQPKVKMEDLPLKSTAVQSEPSKSSLEINDFEHKNIDWINRANFNKNIESKLFAGFCLGKAIAELPPSVKDLTDDECVQLYLMADHEIEDPELLARVPLSFLSPKQRALRELHSTIIKLNEMNKKRFQNPNKTALCHPLSSSKDFPSLEELFTISNTDVVSTLKKRGKFPFQAASSNCYSTFK